MYKVISDLTVKVQGVIKTFPAGSIVKLPEKAAQMFIKQGKLRLVLEDLPLGYELHERMAIMGESAEGVMPYVTSLGILVIPFDSPEKYHYWKDGGQSVCDTLRGIGRCDLIPKYKSIYSN